MEVVPPPEVIDTAIVQFNTWSWVVVVVYILASTWLGHFMAGKQSTMKDFFLGGRQLPWPAVSGSIIATEISAMTIVGVPAFLWAETGDMRYGILAIGNILGRIVVGFLFVPAWYEREIYSPYEYIGNRLGITAQRTASILFVIGGMLGQGTRVLLTAIVLNVMTGLDVVSCIVMVGVVAIVWTFIGGIATVIWTDVVQFFIFLLTAVATLIIVGLEIHGHGISYWHIWETAWNEGKMTIFDPNPWYHLDLRENYTLFASLVAVSIGGLAAYGTDQMMVQRAFCCRGKREAFLALVWSSVGQVIMLTCLLVGVALWYFYQKAGIPNVPNPEELLEINENTNRLVPVFVKYRVHWFLGGIIVAGIFAAAISSLDSILAALAEQTMTALKHGGYVRDDDPGIITKSRFVVVVWGVVLTGVAYLFYRLGDSADLLIELALGVVGLAAGGILGTFLMALIPAWRRDSSHIPACAALSVLSVFALIQHTNWAFAVIVVACLGVMAAIVVVSLSQDRPVEQVLMKLCVGSLFVGLIIALNRVQYVDGERIRFLTTGWPWYAVVGVIVMLSSALLICDRPRGENENGAVGAGPAA